MTTLSQKFENFAEAALPAVRVWLAAGETMNHGDRSTELQTLGTLRKRWSEADQLDMIPAEFAALPDSTIVEFDWNDTTDVFVVEPNRLVDVVRDLADRYELADDEQSLADAIVEFVTYVY